MYICAYVYLSICMYICTHRERESMFRLRCGGRRGANNEFSMHAQYIYTYNLCIYIYITIYIYIERERD